MPATVDVGQGTIVVFTSSGFTAEIEDIKTTGLQRNSIATSHLGTPQPGPNQFANKTFIPSKLTDPGELQMQVHFNPQVVPPINGFPEDIIVTFPLAQGDSTPATWRARGFVTSYDWTVPLEEKMMSSMNVKLTGAITITPAS